MGSSEADDLPADWQAMARADWCALPPAAPGASLEAARQAHAANRPREAGALAAEVARSAVGADRSADRWAAWILQARAWKVMACDREALALLDQALAADAAPSPLRCLAQGRRARLTISARMDDADRRAQAVLACATPEGPDDAASEALTTRAMVALARSELANADTLTDQALARAASPLARAEAWRVKGSLRLRRDPDQAAASAAFAKSESAALAADDAEALAIARIERAAIDGDAERLATGLALARAGGMRRVLAYAAHHDGQRALRERTGPALVAGARRIAAAAALSATLGDVAQERAQRANLAAALLLLGDESAARTQAVRAGELARQSGLPREEAKAEQTLATLARLADPPRLDEARERLVRALATLQAHGDDPSDVALAKSEMASLQMALGQPEAAVAEMQDALALAQRSATLPEQTLLLANLGWAAWDAGQPGRALAAWRAALGADEPQARALAWWGLARQARRADQPLLALDRYARATGEVERMRPGPGQVEPRVVGAFDRRFSQLYREYAGTLADLGLPAQAQAVALLTQRQELLEAHWSGSRAGAGMLQPPSPLAPEPLDQCQPVAAAEQQWRAMQAELARQRPPGPALCCDTPDSPPCPAADASRPPAADAARTAGYCALRTDLVRAETALDRAQRDCVANLRRRLATQDDDAGLFALERSFDQAWVKASAGTPVHLLVTIAEPDRLRLLLRYPGQRDYRIATVPVTPEQLARQLARVRDGMVQAEQIKRQPPSAARTAALDQAAAALRVGVLRELYTLLFGAFDPVDRPGAWAAGSTLALVLDQNLRDLPVAALHDGRAYLGEQVATVLVTAGAAAQSGVAASPGGGGAARSLVVGITKPDLPHVRAEVLAVANALQTTAYLDEDGTTDRVRGWLLGLPPDQPALAMHLAAHATMGGTQASSLVHLWGDRPLTGQDLDQKAMADALLALRLVVFSACSSAASRGGLALGLAGVAERGARSVLGSLWNVDDASTATLMAAFYRAWLGPQAPGVAGALASAQAALRQVRGYEHPYFWAPFTVVGRWD